MPQDIKIWEITHGNKLEEIHKTKLDLEERLENWIEKDITIISNDLLIIGRQISTDFGGVIDLLCLDYNGDIVIIELKRDKTPREITAQVLDYASWVDDLSNEKISEIADKYLKEKGPLDKAFQEKFGTEIPEILNEHHKMLIVASKIDSSSERIVEYLSNTYGVGINAATFQYFKDKGTEFLARVFLIEPSEADHRIQTKTASKRKPPLTYEELEEIAKKNGVGDLYQKIFEGLSRHFDQNITTLSSVAFIGIMGENKTRNTIFSILPKQSDSEKGLHYDVYINRFLDYFNINIEKAKTILPSYMKWGGGKWGYGEDGKYGGGEGYFKDEEQFNKFLAKLAEIKKK